MCSYDVCVTSSLSTAISDTVQSSFTPNYAAGAALDAVLVKGSVLSTAVPLLFNEEGTGKHTPGV